MFRGPSLLQFMYLHTYIFVGGPFYFKLSKCISLHVQLLARPKKITRKKRLYQLGNSGMLLLLFFVYIFIQYLWPCGAWTSIFILLLLPRMIYKNELAEPSFKWCHGSTTTPQSCKDFLTIRYTTEGHWDFTGSQGSSWAVGFDLCIHLVSNKTC